MSSRRSSGEILRLAKFQVDRPTVDYPSDDGASDALPRNTPTKIGRYTVLDLLGVGGMGVVCTAYDPKLDRKVALKLLRKRAKGKRDSRNSTGQARLIREAQALAKLSHPNIVTVHDVDRFEGQIYMAMEYVDGESLDQWMVRGQRTWREVLEIFIHAARGLAAAHAAGITHRDFKPANVLIGKDGRVLVVDFGLAKSHDDKSQDRSATNHDKITDPATFLRERGSLMDVIGSTQDTKLTQVGRTVGTPAYMAPEQFLGLPVGPETDQFSFGVALFEALYGYLPFPDDSRDELIERVTEGRVAEPPKDTPVPSWVHRVVLRALQQRPEDRFPSMTVLIAALQADPAKRRRRALTVVGGVLLAALGGYGVVQALTPATGTCSGAGERMNEVWNATRKATVESAFGEIKRPYAADAWKRVEQELDARTAAWIEHHTEVCEATSVRHEQSPALMDVRMACLERRRGEMRALIEVFQMPDERVVSEAVNAVQGLEDSELCLTMRESNDAPIEDEVVRDQVEEIESMLAQSMARSNSERVQSAIELAASALADARSVGHRPTLARAAVQHAKLRADNTTDAEAAGVRDELIEAITLADETNQPTLEIEVWSKLIVFDGVTRGHPEAGLALQVPAKMALRDVHGPKAEALLEQALGKVLYESGDHQAALEAHMRALEKFEAEGDEESTHIAGALSNIGAEYAMLGQHDNARNFLEQAAAMVEKLYGPHHPMLGSIQLNLGGVLTMEGDKEGARAKYEAAADLFQRALPEGHHRTLRALQALAQAEQNLDPAKAEQRFEQVLSIMRKQKEPNPGLMAITYNSRGHMLRMRAREAAEVGDLETAALQRRKAFDDFTASLEIYDHMPIDSRPTARVKIVELNFCLLEFDRDRVDEAAEHCEEAMALQEQQGDEPDIHGFEAILYLARIEVRRGNESDALALLRKGIGLGTPKTTLLLRLELANMMWKVRAYGEASKLVQEARDAMDGETDADDRLQLETWLREHPL
ncbi:serine/threonine-protein kinase [Paraliomyxa miuraensis]|uniref:serine/threonine-protein kinase n=1 Tax=Paraliomyxa miuraensis TaxID=376150 RepID=UPI00224CC3A2|nr:serine/threonine-protein kinase [Paraliomyxa miuraensis]MCX4244474.1 serine/threonine-protein kinase [Paraliomyxa miuraensis]